MINKEVKDFTAFSLFSDNTTIENKMREKFDSFSKTIFNLSEIDEDNIKNTIRDEIYLMINNLHALIDIFIAETIKTTKGLSISLNSPENRGEIIKVISINNCVAFLDHHLEIPSLGNRDEININVKLFDSFRKSVLTLLKYGYDENSLYYHIEEYNIMISSSLSSINRKLRALYDDVIDKEDSVGKEFGMYVYNYLIFIFQEFYAFYISTKYLTRNLIVNTEKSNED